MTRSDFFEILGSIRRKWYKARRGLDVRTMLRAKLRTGGYVVECCPITAVARKVTGKYYPTASFEMAAKDMGLDKRFACRVVMAADDVTSRSPIRKKLLRTLKVKV